MRQSFTVTGDEGLTRRAIRYLLRTAVTELPSDWHPRHKVSIGVRQGAAQVILSIGVDGPGLRPSQARQVWDPVLGPLLPPAKDDMRAAGLGPYLARRIINLQNAGLGHNLFRIGLENRPKTETRPARGYCYYLAIPIRPMERRRGA
jgi:K+-sensing histidine kinase KdpD